MNFRWDWINHHTLLVNLKHVQWSIVEKCQVQRYFWPIRFAIPRFVSSKNSNSKNCNDPGCPDLDVYILDVFSVFQKQRVLNIHGAPPKEQPCLADFLQKSDFVWGSQSLEIAKKKRGDFHFLAARKLHGSSRPDLIVAHGCTPFKHKWLFEPPDLGGSQIILKNDTTCRDQRWKAKSGKNLHSFWSLSFCSLRNIFLEWGPSSR